MTVPALGPRERPCRDVAFLEVSSGIPRPVTSKARRPHRRSGRLTVLRVLRALVLGLVALTSAAAPAMAHAELVRSQPANGAILPTAPNRVAIWFDEALTPSGSTITVYDGRRHEVDRADSRVDPSNPRHLTVSLESGLPNGIYTVTWTSISADDGHVVHGTFTFTVGLATLPGAGIATSNQGIPSPAAVVARWLVFLGLVVPAGCFLLGLLGLPPAETRRWLPAAGAMVALLADLALVPVQAFLSGGGLPRQPLSNVLAELPAAWRWRLLAEVVLVIAVVIVPRRHERERVAAAGGVLVAAAAVLGLAFTSHAAARPQLHSLALAVESLHLGTVAFWLGAVVQLAAVPSSCRAAQQSVLRRFSRLALGLAPLAMVSGVGLAFLTFPSLASLWTSGYGRILLVKAVLVIGIVACGYRNHRAIATGIRRAAVFACSVRTELIFGVLAILAASTMSLWVPPQPRPVVTLELRRVAGPHLIAHLDVTPIDSGSNRLDAWLTDDQNRPVPGVSGATAEVSMLERPVDLPDLTLTRLPDGHWGGASAVLSVQGWWDVHVSFQGATLAQASQASAQFFVIVPDPLLVGPPPRRPSEPAARQLFTAAMTQLGQLTSMREFQDLSDGAGNSITTLETEVAPDTFAWQTGSGTSSIAIGPWQYYREGNGPWTRQQRPEVFHFPATVLTYYTGATELTLGRQQVVDGENCQILTFYAPATSGRGQAWYAWWVGMTTHLIRQEAMVADHYYMLVHYDEFNARVQITAPPLGPAS